MGNVLAGKKAKINIYGSSVSFVDESTSTNDNITYQIDDDDKNVWSKNGDIVVEDGGVVVSSGYVLDRLSGKVIFDSADIRVITVSGDYLALGVLGCAYEYDYSIDGDNQESTCFESEYIGREQGLLDLSVSISKFYDVNHFLIDELVSDSDFVIELFSDGSSDFDIRCWCKLSSDNPSARVDGLVDESIDFKGYWYINCRVISFG